MQRLAVTNPNDHLLIFWSETARQFTASSPRKGSINHRIAPQLDAGIESAQFVAQINISSIVEGLAMRIFKLGFFALITLPSLWACSGAHAHSATMGVTVLLRTFSEAMAVDHRCTHCG